MAERLIRCSIKPDDATPIPRRRAITAFSLWSRCGAASAPRNLRSRSDGFPLGNSDYGTIIQSGLITFAAIGAAG
jgi:hypothetical protein